MDCTLNIGHLQLSLHNLPWSADAMPRNFRPFLGGDASAAPSAARLDIISAGPCPGLPESKPLSATYNDLGLASLYDAGSHWCIALTPRPDEAPRLMMMDKDLCHASLWLDPADPFAAFVIDSMCRIFFSQYAATRCALMVHASVIAASGLAFLFMGKSGTGKSTHSRLWLECFSDADLLNDDCPMIETRPDGSFAVCGTPWSGKTPCWKQLSVPLGGIVRLRQALVNRFTPLAGVEAFVAFIPGMSVMTSDSSLYAEASTFALRLLDSVPVGILDCRPDRQAALLCRRSLSRPRSI